MGFSWIVFFIPNALGHPDNYIPANSDVTPEHIVPEWYFSPFYAILRSIPDKAFGVLALLASIVMLAVLPFIHKSFLRNSRFKPSYYVSILLFISINVLLGYIGGKPIEDPFLSLGQFLTLAYFTFFPLTLVLEQVDYSMMKFFIEEEKKDPTPTQKEIDDAKAKIIYPNYVDLIYG